MSYADDSAALAAVDHLHEKIVLVPVRNFFWLVKMFLTRDSYPHYRGRLL
jgi:hypothetical protein